MNLATENYQAEINLINHIRYKGEKREDIIVGKMNDGSYLLQVGEASPPVPFSSLVLSEEELLGLIASISLYFKEFEIDLSKKIAEYFNGKTVDYIYSSHEKT